METQLTTVSQGVVQKLNGAVTRVIAADKIQGFEKAYLIAEAVKDLKEVLNSEYMKPIMQLQNNRLGFKTDKQEGGYPEAVVKNCLIEAVLTGVQPFGNQFNIIAGNMYITKEGMGYLLANFPGLVYEIIPELPRIGQDQKSAAIVMFIAWSINGGTRNERKIDFPIKMNAFMGVDAVIGKATRKARAWLFNTLTGMEIGDGDVTDIDHKVVNGGNGSLEAAVTYEQLMALMEEKMPAIDATSFKNYKRILENKEEKSYKKVYDELKSLTVETNE